MVVSIINGEHYNIILESCIQVCQEFITHLETVPLNYLEALLRTAAEGDVINLTSKVIKKCSILPYVCICLILCTNG